MPERQKSYMKKQYMKQFYNKRPQIAHMLIYSLSLLLAGCGNAAYLPAADNKPTVIIEESSLDYSGATSSLQDDQNMQDLTGKDVEIENHMPSESDSLQTNEDTPLAGLHTLHNFLHTAFLPVGNTMYVWGGGWNEEDTGAGEEARSIGISPRWKSFADLQSADYDYRDTRYQIHDGLDCSGYVGWVVYNVMETESGEKGYVFKSTDTAKTYASYDWGDYLEASATENWLPGDIASMKGHVWISLGTCDDGSVLLVHASPPGVRLCGTDPADQAKSSSEAVALATNFMSSHYPEWYDRFPNCSVDRSYLTASDRMRWNTDTFPDAKEIQSLTPSEILELMEGKNAR